MTPSALADHLLHIKDCLSRPDWEFVVTSFWTALADELTREERAHWLAGMSLQYDPQRGRVVHLQDGGAQ